MLSRSARRKNRPEAESQAEGLRLPHVFNPPGGLHGPAEGCPERKERPAGRSVERMRRRIGSAQPPDFAAIASTSILNSGRTSADTITSVDATESPGT